MSHAGTSSTSAPGSNARKHVEIIYAGQSIGPNGTSFSSFLGNVTRTHCPITYNDWRAVPDTIKENVWSIIVGTYDIDSKHKKDIIKRVNGMWRDWKHELRKTYDKFDQDGERKRNCPNGVKQEEWDKFIDSESTVDAKNRRQKGKYSRKELKYPQLSGRRGSARTEELMRNENPNAVITRTDLFLATHTRSDGSYPTQELSDATGKLREIIASDPASIRMDLNNDPVAQVCGRDRKGRVRGLGNISKTTIIASTPYVEEIRAKKNEIDDVKASMTELKKEMAEQRNENKNMYKNMEQQIIELKQQILSNAPLTMQCSFGTAASQANLRSGEASSLRGDSAPTQRMEQIYSLTNMRRRVVGRGRIITDYETNIPSECVKIILDAVDDPSADVFDEVGDRTLGDCDLGEVLIWPRVLTRPC